ncbi:asparaginase [Methylibium sp.]|uniref:asparaginase n=1 Tax=Methylibium sp. TaxID=2067992 RepID=UPI002DB6F6E8|nr:asparaginase [Methylibium sp.]
MPDDPLFDDRRVVLLATGGTIAGTAASATDTLGYRAAQIDVRELVQAVPSLAGMPLDAEQVAQLDSKDMDFDVMLRLARRVAHHLAREEVAGIVVTHGTDTLEETAWLLQRLLAPAKPVVLTGAMHPATALLADGPQNLVDAVGLAREPAAQRLGVVVVFGGRVFAAAQLRKRHAWRLDAFGGGDAAPLGEIVAGRVGPLQPAPPHAPALGLELFEPPWPWVEILTSAAGADARVVEALVAAGVEGIVVAGTGNGTVHHRLEAALLDAQARGVAVRRSTRVASGAVLDAAPQPIVATRCATPVQARIELMLEIAAGRR